MKLDLVRKMIRTAAIVGALGSAACGGKASPSTSPMADRVEPAAPAASSSDREREAAIKGAEQTTAAHEENENKASADTAAKQDAAAQQKADEDKAAADKAVADQAAAEAADAKAASDAAAKKKSSKKPKKGSK